MPVGIGCGGERPAMDGRAGPWDRRCAMDGNRAVRECADARAVKMAMTPPTDLGARIIRYRCCLPALAGFSN